jgi:hypothetical protein
MLGWCLFFCIWHWRGGGVIVWIRIITTFNLPSMRWWWWRTMNINYWCPWRSHNLKLNEKRKESNEHYFSLILSMIKFLFSYFFSLFLYRSDIHCICMCVHHLWLKKDRWISRYLLLDFAHVIWWNLKQKKSGEEEEEIRQLLFLLEYEQSGIDIDNGDDCCIRNETSFVLEVIIRLWD